MTHSPAPSPRPCSGSARFRRFAAFAAGAALLATAACGGSDTGSGGDLSVGIDLTYPPYDQREDGQPAGFDVEFVDAMTEKMGMTPDYQDVRFAQIIQGLKGNRYDMVASALYFSAERLEQVDMVPYFQTGSSIIVAGDSDATELTDLCGRSVGALTGSVHHDAAAEKIPSLCDEAGEGAVDAREYPTDPEATSAMRAGQVQATVTDAAVAADVVESSDGALKLLDDELLWPTAVGLAVNKGNDELRASIEQAIQEMKDDGTYERLLESYNLEPVDDRVLEESKNS
ncbi:glutamine ABC transporter substrate-binding protein [Prauserella halophila]|uniref:Glutamine ABC transporter substrate-binding protein n=1 Tax=Prauserella halophila TaxID=185641 RepID=A0ABN1W1V9_9PSEU|nr:transporter substrate-binding domain-containing protein [Prauserella halophila]MCP2236517.1 polar amino acid transport system substrate-binding protein [Prauserella halophila]